MTRTSQALAAIGRGTLSVGSSAIRLYVLTFQTMLSIVCFRFSFRQTVRQAYEIGNRSVFFIAVTLGILGFISVYQVAHQIAQILPDFSMLGPAFLQIMVREFGPTIVGLMVATRVGSGIAAEIGSMVVTEQVDALRMCNADPVDYLVAPRTVACAVMVLLLTSIGILVAMITGMLIAESAYGISPSTFVDLQLVAPDDVIIGVVKALAYGIAIPIIAADSGLNTHGGSEGVGWATTRAVVNTSFAVIVLDFIISAAGYMFY
jgi:phospholipid/cholesterol/gamma-HCH transport system permease protein